MLGGGHVWAGGGGAGGHQRVYPGAGERPGVPPQHRLAQTLQQTGGFPEPHRLPPLTAVCQGSTAAPSLQVRACNGV